jgi:hypothetical protein
MNRYLIIAPHTAEDCTKVIKQVEAQGVITRYDWGCKDGEHCGWVTIEAENKKEAVLVVPPLERPRARIIELSKFTAEEVRRMHTAGNENV